MQNVYYNLTVFHAESFPPTLVNVPSVIEVKVNEKTNLTLKVNLNLNKDVRFYINTTFRQEDFTLSKLKLEKNSAFSELHKGAFIDLFYISDGSAFVWMPTVVNASDLPNMYLKVTAINDLGLASTYWPTIKLCSCENHGICLNESISNNEFSTNAGGQPIHVTLISIAMVTIFITKKTHPNCRKSLSVSVSV